jgi:PAS domain S-box
MKKLSFSQLVNIDLLNNMANNLYKATGIPVGIIDTNGQILVSTGWQDICTKFHRVNPETRKRCYISDQFIEANLTAGKCTQYKCLNNLWDIGVPLIISGEHMVTLFLGQFFYENEVIDTELFRKQALAFGFNENEYMDALMKVPRYSKEKIQNIIDYYIGLVMTLAESGLSRLQYEEYKQELDNNQQYFKTILNSVNDAIFIQQVNGTVIDVNEAALEMFGYSREEMIGMNSENMILNNADGSICKIEQMEMLMRKKNPLIQEFVVKDKENRAFYVEANMHKVNINDNEIVVSTIRNITERKQAELILKNEAKEMEKLRTEFFANVSHELRTPLSIILSSLQVVKMHIQNEDKALDRDKINHNLNIQKQNCFRLLRLVNNLIDSTKLNSGNFEINLNNYNIVDIVEQITMSVAEYINNNGLNLVFDTDVEEKIMAFDPNIIERIIFNLLSNSIKFTNPGGNIFVNIKDGKDYVTICVEDTGIGIPEEKVNLIFDRFTQVDKSFTRKNEGSGIGLSLVKSLVEMMDGTISVESKSGVGTSFSIRLPVRVLEDDNSEKTNKLLVNSISNYMDSMEIEFSDITDKP